MLLNNNSNINEYKNEFNPFALVDSLLKRDLYSTDKVIGRKDKSKFKVKFTINIDLLYPEGFQGELYISEKGYIHLGRTDIFIENDPCIGTYEEIRLHKYQSWNLSSYLDLLQIRLQKKLESIGCEVIDKRKYTYTNKGSLEFDFNINRKTSQSYREFCIQYIDNLIKDSGLGYDITSIQNKLLVDIESLAEEYKTSEVELYSKNYTDILSSHSFFYPIFQEYKNKDEIEIFQIKDNFSILYLFLIRLYLSKKIEFPKDDLPTMEIVLKDGKFPSPKGFSLFLDEEGDVYKEDKYLGTLAGEQLKFFKILFHRPNQKVKVKEILEILYDTTIPDNTPKTISDKKNTLKKRKERMPEEIKRFITNNEDWFRLQDTY